MAKTRQIVSQPQMKGQRKLKKIVFYLATLSIKPRLGGFGLDWLCWSAGKFKTTPTIQNFQIILGKKNHSSEVEIAPKLYTYFLIYSRCEWFDCRWESALSEVGRSLPPSSSSIFEVRPTRPEAMAASSSIGRPVCTTKFLPASFWGCK